MDEINLVLVAAILVMLLLGLIPRRYCCFQLPAVLGRVLIWVDGEFTGHRIDAAGVAVTGPSLLWLAVSYDSTK